MQLSWLLHHPTSFRVWRRGSSDHKRLQPWPFPFTCSAGGPQVSARLLGPQSHSAPLFDHQLLSLPVCFSGLVSCPVHQSVSSSLFVLCLLCVSAGYLAPQHRKANNVCPLFLVICFMVVAGSCSTYACMFDEQGRRLYSPVSMITLWEWPNPC